MEILKGHILIIYRLFFLVGISVISITCLRAQGGEWTWLKGDSAKNKNGIYGTKGTEAASNNPGARDGQFTWSDNSGNLWMFSGEGYANSGGSVTNLNDVWKYNVATNNWTWIFGDSSAGNKYGIYGTIGVSAPTNKPGARWNGAAWRNSAGNFLAFGGVGRGQIAGGTRLSDLWLYNPTINEWTWLKGDTITDRNGKYGTKGTPSSTNNPGARHAPGSWKDAADNLYVFGGHGFPAAGARGELNDLWKYEPSTNNWTWLLGDSVRNKKGVYGTKGVPAASNNPGGRYSPLSWQDSSGLFYMMGGIGYSASSGSAITLNDLWTYSTSTNQWTWLGGDSVLTTSTSYGTKCLLASGNQPGGRRYGAAWIDNITHDLWMMGGEGYASGSATVGYLNDIWVFDFTGNKWMWVNGNNTKNNFAVYGTKGVSAATNTPGAKYHMNRTDWIDTGGNLYLFGGCGYCTPTTPGPGSSLYMNDMWRFKVQGACNSTLPIELISFYGDNIKGNNELSWITASEVNNDYFLLERSADGKSFKEFEKIPGGGNSSKLSKYHRTDFYPFDLTYYRLKNVDYDGSFNYSKIIALKNTRAMSSNTNMIIYPNPSHGNNLSIQLKGYSEEEKVLVVLMDILGQTVYSNVAITNSSGIILEAIDRSQKLIPGVYMITGSVKNEIYKQKIVIK